eukprot:6341-Heterococcus_DN1.PRE.4
MADEICAHVNALSHLSHWQPQVECNKAFTYKLKALQQLCRSRCHRACAQRAKPYEVLHVLMSCSHTLARYEPRLMFAVCNSGA